VPAWPRERVVWFSPGATRFARIVEIRRTGTLTIPTRDGDKILPVRVVVRPPDRVIMETGAGDEQMRRVVGPGEAYKIVGGKRTPLAAMAARSLARLGHVDEALLARSALAGGVAVKGLETAGAGQLPPELVPEPVRGVRLEDPVGSQFLLVVPTAGGLPTRVDYRSAGPDGVEADLSDHFSDWRVVDGLLFPFEVMMFQNQRGLGLLRFATIEIDLAPEVKPRP
jgi:hypothetical protein